MNRRNMKFSQMSKDTKLKFAQLPECTCPSCGKKLDASHCLTDSPDCLPGDGDFTLCVGCGELLRFTKTKLRKANEADKKELHPDQMEIVKTAQHNIRAIQYAEQIKTMAQRAMEWRKQNPHREALIAYQAPVIGPISEAVDCGLVRANGAGIELLKALWPWGDRREPTVLMCRTALEYENGQIHPEE